MLKYSQLYSWLIFSLCQIPGKNLRTFNFKTALCFPGNLISTTKKNYVFEYRDNRVKHQIIKNYKFL
jgi:hypothetical protein